MSEEGQINISINTVLFSNIRLLKPANLGAGLKVFKGFRDPDDTEDEGAAASSEFTEQRP